MKRKIRHRNIEFVIDNSHYFIPLNLIKAFSSTICEKAQNKNFNLYKFENLIDPQGLFDQIINLFYGQEIDINQENAFFFGYVGDILGINALSEATNSYRQAELTTENIFDFLFYLDTFHIIDSRIIKFAGENWPFVSKSEKVIQLSFFILNEIFSKNPQINADFDFVSKVVELNSLDFWQDENELQNNCSKNDYVLLFKYCDFSKLNSFQLNEIFDYVSFDSIPPEIAKKFILRISEDKSEKEEKNENDSNQSNQQQQSTNIPKQQTQAQTNKTTNSPSSTIPNKFKYSINSSSSNNLIDSTNKSTESIPNKFKYSIDPSSSNNSIDSANKTSESIPNKFKYSIDSSSSNNSIDSTNKTSESIPNKFKYSIDSSSSNNSIDSTNKATEFSPNKFKYSIDSSSSNNSVSSVNKTSESTPNKFKYSINSSSSNNSVNSTNQHPASSSNKPVDSTNSSSTEITIPSSGVYGSRKSKPQPVLPPPGGSVDVSYENGFELSGVIYVFQSTPSLQKSLWKNEVDLIVPENTNGEYRYCLFDHSRHSWWCNYDGKICSIDKAWVIVGFPNYRLSLTYYTIAVKAKDLFYSQPKSWKIYGSNNPDSFDEKDMICYVKNAPAMNIPNPMRTFAVEEKAKPYSYFKFVMLENFTKNPKNEGEISLTGIELFGVLTSK